MNRTSGSSKAAADKLVKTIRRQTRQTYSAEETIRIVLAGLRGAERIEEMQHADKLIDRIIFLEGHPNLRTLDPPRIGENGRESLICDLAAEMDALK